jgi:hypothetical protein
VACLPFLFNWFDDSLHCILYVDDLFDHMYFIN